MRPAPLRRWRALSDSAKYRSYTRWTLEASVVFGAIATMAAARSLPIVLVATVAVAVAALLAFETRPELTGRTAGPADRWSAAASAALFVATWIGGVVTRAVYDEETARAVGWLVVAFSAISLIAFLPYRWYLAVGLAVATAFAYGSPLGYLPHIAALSVIALFCIAMTRLSMWAVRIVDDLDAARETQARLQVAEERLRFSRDLHDVVGRGFSTIAVKSELASRLARAGAADRAADEMDEVKALAVASMEEMRSLVRGYRGIDLAGEVAGARALLDSAGCVLTVDGAIDAVPKHLHEAAAWVVREGTTNIVRHSSATVATLALGSAGMTLTNDGVVGPPGARSGLRGLAERLAAVGATADTHADDGAFTLEIRWEHT